MATKSEIFDPLEDRGKEEGSTISMSLPLGFLPLSDQEQKQRDEAYRRRYLQTSCDSFFSEEAEMERAKVNRIEYDMEEEKNKERERNKAKARDMYERSLAEDEKGKSIIVPPKVYSKSIFGWHDPLLDPKEHVIVSIDGVDVKWREEEELNTELVDKLFEENLKGNEEVATAAADEKITAAWSSPTAAMEDISQDSVEMSINRRGQAVEKDVFEAIDELNVSEIREQEVDIDASIIPNDITFIEKEEEIQYKQEKDKSGTFERFIKQTASAIRIQCTWRQKLARNRVQATRGSLVVSGQTAVTILQKWLHIAKINLRIKKVDENQRLITIFQNRAARTITRFIRTIIRQKQVKMRRLASERRKKDFNDILRLKKQQHKGAIYIQKYVRRFIEQCRWINSGAKEFLEEKSRKGQSELKAHVEGTAHTIINVIDKIKSLQREHEHDIIVKVQCFIRQWLARRKAYKFFIINETTKATG